MYVENRTNSKFLLLLIKLVTNINIKIIKGTTPINKINESIEECGSNDELGLFTIISPYS